MSVGAATAFVSLLSGMALFLALALEPRHPRSAQAGWRLLAYTLGPVATALAILACGGILIEAVLFHVPVPGAGGPATGIVVTTMGIVLLYRSFPVARLIRTVPLEYTAGYLTGFAWASCWPAAWSALATGNPVYFLLGAAGGILADTLDRWVIRYTRKVDIHVVPDPLAPDPSLVASALSDAVLSCHTVQAPLSLRLYPGQGQDGDWIRYRITLDTRNRRIEVQGGSRTASAPMGLPVTCDGYYTVTTGDSPLDLAIACTHDGGVRFSVNSWRREWTHSLAFATMLSGLTALVAGSMAGLVLGGALCLRLLLDQAGFTATALAWPFSRTLQPGLQRVPPARRPFVHGAILWLALLVTGWNLLRAIVPGAPWVLPAPLILAAGITPLVGLPWIRRLRRAESAS